MTYDCRIDEKIVESVEAGLMTKSEIQWKWHWWKNHKFIGSWIYDNM